MLSYLSVALTVVGIALQATALKHLSAIGEIEREKRPWLYGWNERCFTARGRKIRALGTFSLLFAVLLGFIAISV